MPGFFGIWLPIWVCTCCAVLYRYLSDLEYTSLPIITVVVAELVALVVWGLYWTTLYPNYFTPFRHLPTPSVCRSIAKSIGSRLSSCFRYEHSGTGIGSNSFLTDPGRTSDMSSKHCQAKVWSDFTNHSTRRCC